MDKGLPQGATLVSSPQTNRLPAGATLINQTIQNSGPTSVAPKLPFVGSDQPAAGSIGNAIENTFMQGGKNVMKDISNEPNLVQPSTGNGVGDIGMNATKNVLALGATAGHIAGDVASTAGGIIGSVISPFIPQAIKSKVGDITQAISDKVNAIPGMTPEIAKSLGDVFNTLTLKGGEETPDVSNYIKGRIEGGDKTFSTALSDVTPDFKTATPTEKGNLITQPSVNGTPRVQEGGFFSGRTVTSNLGEAEIANKLSTVPGYDTAKTMLDKSNLIQDQIAKEGNQMRASLQNEPYIAPVKEIQSVVTKAVKSVPDNSLVLSKSDPVISNYLRVVNNAAQNITGNLEGVLNLKQTLDAAYKNARGKMAFGDSRMTSLDEVHTAARDALTKYMIDHAQNTDVKTALRSQHLLYKADDIISAKAAKEGDSTMERLLQKPGIKTGAKIIKQTIPYGLGSHLPI